MGLNVFDGNKQHFAAWFGLTYYQSPDILAAVFHHARCYLALYRANYVGDIAELLSPSESLATSSTPPHILSFLIISDASLDTRSR